MLRPPRRLLRTLLALVLLAPSSLLAAPPQTITVPVDIAAGPAALWFSDAIGSDQLGHFALKIRVEAILSHTLIHNNIQRVPAQYRNLAEGMAEVRYRPSLLIPEELIVSPKLFHTGMYGMTWRPLQLGLNLVAGAAPLGLSAGLDLTYAFIHSDSLGFAWMNFLRPGLDLQLEWEVPLADSLHLSVGWQSALYVPQPLGGGVFELGGFNQRSIWHVGQVFLLFHGFMDYKASF